MILFRYLLIAIFTFSLALCEVDESKINYSIWLNPPNSKGNFILQLNIRHDMFIFQKTSASNYESEFSIQLEVFDSTWKTITREYVNANLKCNNYEETISQELFFSNQLTLNLQPDKYNCRLSIIDKNDSKEFEVGNFKVSFDSSKTTNPVIIKQSDLKSLENDTTYIPFTNFIKFSSEKYLLLLPAYQELHKVQLQCKDTLIDLKKRMSKGLNYYIISLDSLPLIDDSYFLKIKSSTEEYDLPLKVKWINKPQTLSNFELALKLMSYTFDESIIKKIKKSDSDEQYSVFFKFWKKFDKTPKTAFNELMSEFYKRADKAISQFSTINQTNGALTDRGKIYILYGMPDNIERKFAPDGKAIEYWYYSNDLKHKFTFVDERKNGNLILKNK